MSSNFMHVIGRAFAAVLVVAAASISAPVAAQECPALLSHTFPKLQDESPQSLCQYKGMVVLAVNTPSYCGFTPQYEGLEKLRKGMRVLIREGSVSKDLRALVGLLTERHSPYLCLCTDDRNPLDIAEEGHLDYMIREAIRNAALPAGRSRVVDVLAARYPDLVRWDPSAADAEARLAALEAKS